MKPIESELYELAHLRSERDPIVSVYLDSRCWSPTLRDELRHFIHDRLEWAREHAPMGGREDLEKTLERIERYVSGLYLQVHDQSAQGIALFACEGLGLWRVFRFSHRLRNHFSMGRIPHLIRFARFAFDYQPAVVVSVDARGAWVFETVLGEVVGEVRIDHPVHERHSMGGWSQFRYQRHVDQQVERNHEEVASHVIYLLDLEPSSQLVLAGTPREVAAFESVLPKRAKERILVRLSAPSARGYREGEIRTKLIEEAVEEVFQTARQGEGRALLRVVREALAGGLAELGPEDVVLAANEGRIYRLLIEHGFDRMGSRCLNCDALMARMREECPYCGQEVEDVPLGEELASKVLRSGGSVEVFEARPLFDHYAGLAAVLRNRGSRAQLGAAYEEPQPLPY